MGHVSHDQVNSFPSMQTINSMQKKELHGHRTLTIGGRDLHGRGLQL